MKSIIIGIVIAALLIGGIAGASVLYDNLSEQYNKENNGGFQVMDPIKKPDLTQDEPGSEENSEPANDQEESRVDGEDNSENVSGEIDSNEITTEKSEESAESSDVSDENIEDNTENKDQTTENVEETTEEIVETTEKAEETTEKIEVVFNAPDFTVLDWDGNNVKLSSFACKPIVLNFWATWCYYCREEMPEFNEAFKNLPNIEFVMVNATDGVDETVAGAKKYIESQGFEFNVYFDTTSQAQHTYGVGAYPTTFFISADGSEIYYISGRLSYELLMQGIGLITD